MFMLTVESHLVAEQTGADSDFDLVHFSEPPCFSLSCPVEYLPNAYYPAKDDP
jgi:hypothetical protein